MSAFQNGLPNQTPSPGDTFKFTLERDEKPSLIRNATLVCICIGGFLLFIAVMIFILYNTIYIRVYYKRRFGVYIVGKTHLLVFEILESDLNSFFYFIQLIPVNRLPEYLLMDLSKADFELS